MEWYSVVVVIMGTQSAVLSVCVCVSARVSPGDLQQHLQTMFTLLRPEDNIKLVSKHTHTCMIKTQT